MPGSKWTSSRFKDAPSGVWALGFVSMLMDVSSEMIHASLPVYMVSVLGTSTLAVGTIEGLDRFDPDHGRLTGRLIIIDTEDVEHPPALNMFDMSSERLARYTPAQREQVEGATIELYDYIFRALSADLTAKQGVAFAFVARLLLTIPGATIHTLRELMEDPSPSIDKSPFHDPIARLDDTARAFFEAHFFTKAFVDTKRQIARRIYDFIRNKSFERMFSSPVNKLDMFEAMNSGAIVLVNTSKALLKSAASALFGRTMIALTLRAAFERVTIPPDDRRPAFLIIDEAAHYFDANTAIKFAGGVSDKDARLGARHALQA